MNDLFADKRARHSHKAGLITRQPTTRAHHPDFDKLQMKGWKSVEREADLPNDAWKREQKWALRMGLTGADSIEDKTIPTFARGELPHYAGINTFLKAPYIEDATRCHYWCAF